MLLVTMNCGHIGCNLNLYQFKSAHILFHSCSYTHTSKLYPVTQLFKFHVDYEGILFLKIIV